MPVPLWAPSKPRRYGPNLPDDCRKQERSGVRMGEPLDTALIRTDRALGRANARVKRCADWHDQVGTGIEEGTK